MRPTDAIRGKAAGIRRLIESYGFVEPKLFGSAARGDDHDGSDLDLLATIPPAMAGKISLFDIAELEDKLQALVGGASRLPRLQQHARAPQAIH